MGMLARPLRTFTNCGGEGLPKFGTTGTCGSGIIPCGYTKGDFMACVCLIACFILPHKSNSPGALKK